MKYSYLRSFSLFIKISDGHAWAEAEVFSGDHAVCVLLQVLHEAIRESRKDGMKNQRHFGFINTTSVTQTGSLFLT